MVLQGTEDVSSEKTSKDVEKDANISQEERTELPQKQHETKNGSKNSSTEDEKLTEDSPIMGVLNPKPESRTQGSPVNERRIKKALLERTDYLLANMETITLAGVRRLLEGDLGLDKNALDTFKEFIKKELDQVLSSPESPKPAKDVKKKTSERSKPAKDVKQKTTKNTRTKTSEKLGSEEEESDSSGSESDEMESEVKSRKKAASNRNIVKPKQQPKKRKVSEVSDDEVSGKKQNKIAKRQKEENASNEDDESTSQDGRSQSSAGKPAQRNAKPAAGYGKRVENLKSIIKACGMSVPPSIYKKAKQVPDDEREAFIVEELEGILSKEGLSKNPTEKEIKDCRKRKERARELEGIDMGNIISSSRRRSTASFMSPPKPEMVSSKRTEKVDAKDKKKKEDSEDNETSDSNVEKKDNAEDLEKDKEEKKDDKEQVEEGGDGEEEEEADEEEDEDDDEEDEEEDEESEEVNEDVDEDSD